MLNLDTHILVALFTGDLTAPEHECALSQSWAISDIVLWELSKLTQKRRMYLNAESPRFRAFLRSLTVLPITFEIAWASTRLDFSSDPADEIIAATSIVEGIPLLTRDRLIRRSRLVPLAL
ncbi:MAG TPA: PIN domain-containing protein [Terriglobia bacterium]|nr:PIN domain-containing protein [Terriglobia bacterium]